MASNIAVDYVLGSVPLVGDAFDVYWKANLKNVELLQRYTLSTRLEQRKARSGDWLFVAGLMALLVALLVGCVTIAWWIVAGLWHLLGAG
jgi:fatty acid desaturase